MSGVLYLRSCAIQVKITLGDGRRLFNGGRTRPSRCTPPLHTFINCTHTYAYTTRTQTRSLRLRARSYTPAPHCVYPTRSRHHRWPALFCSEERPVRFQCTFRVGDSLESIHLSTPRRDSTGNGAPPPPLYGHSPVRAAHIFSVK